VRGASLRTADGLEQMQAAAAARRGVCLATDYTGRLARLRSTLAEMQAVARSRGGQCLSAEYRNARVKLTWECDRGHVWENRFPRRSRGDRGV
jgi:FAD/FMN-containing dehydrogenase